MSFYNNPFYNPRSDYYGTVDFRTTPAVTQDIDPKHPQGVYTDFLAGFGLTGMDRKSDWAASLFGKTQNGYEAARRINPALTYQQYLHKQFGGNQLGDMWAGLTPNQRGENVSRYAPETRFIGWG